MMKIRTILALTDFSVQGNHALERAGQLAAEHAACLHILYVDFGGKPDCADAATRLDHHARQLSRQLGLTVTAVVLEEASAERVAQKARTADLVVLGHEQTWSWASLLGGDPVLQLMRLCQCPVLVTRTASGKPYDRVLVAVDFTPESMKLAQLACLLSSGALIELFHAVSTHDEGRLRRADVSENAIKAYQNACVRYARGRLLLLTDSFDSRRNRVLSAIGHGDPARQAMVQQEYVGADLMVVGKRRSSSLRDFFFNSVAQRLLRHARADLLIIPHDFQVSTRALALSRIQAERAGAGAALLTTRRSLP